MPIHEDQLMHSRQKSFSTSSIEPQTSNYQTVFKPTNKPVQVLRLSDLVIHSPGGPHSNNHIQLQNQQQQQHQQAQKQLIMKQEPNLIQGQTFIPNVSSSEHVPTSASAINYKRPIDSDGEENAHKKFEHEDMEAESANEENDNTETNHFVLAPTPAQLGRAPLQRRQNSSKLGTLRV